MDEAITGPDLHSLDDRQFRWENAPDINVQKYTELHNVRIIPGTMVFKDAFDGKRYKQKLTLINRGKYTAKVRIYPPSSNAFKIKPLIHGVELPAGLSVVRYVSFVYCSATFIQEASLRIYINDTLIKYPLLVFIVAPKLSVNPDVLDFGEINVGNTSQVKTLELKNSGTNVINFSMDLHSNELEMVVHPIMGSVKPNETITISFGIFGTYEGNFLQEFYIKSDPPLRVTLQGKFILPLLILEHPIPSKSCITISFPKTYYGICRHRSLVFRHSSSSPGMFTSVTRHENKEIPFKEARNTIDCYKEFDIVPYEGRLLPGTRFILNVSFLPRKMKNTRNKSTYFLCLVELFKVDYRVGELNENVCKIEENVEHIIVPDNIYSQSTESLGDSPCEEIQLHDTHFGVFIYGEVVEPKIKLSPSEIYLPDLVENEVYSFNISIHNLGKHLPIVVKYCKTVCIEADPKLKTLEANEEYEVILNVTPTKIGQFKGKIKFDLYDADDKELTVLESVLLPVCYNVVSSRKPLTRKFVMGLTPIITNEVGFLTEDVRFNTKIMKPIQAVVDNKLECFHKYNNALIAFPNDRPKSLKPWRSRIPCHTIFASLPRTIAAVDLEYELNPSQMVEKDYNKSYYANYISSSYRRRTALNCKKPTRTLLSDYDLTNKKMLFLRDINIEECEGYMKNIRKNVLCIPLTPTQLRNVIITPKCIMLGKIAQNFSCCDKFIVENKNGFPISVVAKSSYPSINLPETLIIVKPNQAQNIPFCYSCPNYGKQHVSVNIIINMCHIFDVTVLARISPKIVVSLASEVVFYPENNGRAFFEVWNPLLSYVSFTIESKFSSIKPEQTIATIPPRRKMLCSLRHTPEFGEELVKEITIISENGSKELIKVSLADFGCFANRVTLTTRNVEFGDISLNIACTKEFNVKNLLEEDLLCKIKTTDLPPEITISPMEFLIPPKSYQNIKVAVIFKELVEFNYPTEIELHDASVKTFCITGRVVVPLVEFTPESFKLPKIYGNGMYAKDFEIKNIRNVDCFITFPLEDYPEFFVTDSTGSEASKVNIKPGESVIVTFEFRPTTSTSFNLVLPYMINDILGPPELNDKGSLVCQNYLKSLEQGKYISPLEDSSELNTLKIYCAAWDGWLSFNSLHITGTWPNPQINPFTIENISKEPRELIIDVSDLGSDFLLEMRNYEYDESVDVITSIVEPNETLSMEFVATVYGIFNKVIPIYVRDIGVEYPYNFLKLTAVYPSPCVLSSERFWFFGSIRSFMRVSKSINVNLKMHCAGCGPEALTITCPEEIITITRGEIVCNQRNDWQMNYVITVHPTCECIVDTNITICCECMKVPFVLTVQGVVDNSSLVSYYQYETCTKRLNNDLSSEVLNTIMECPESYPFFPKDCNCSCSSNLMWGILNSVENWLYCQGFYCNNYYEIPEGMARYPPQIQIDKDKDKQVKKDTKKRNDVLPLVQLLVNLVDSSVLKYLQDGTLEPSEDETQQTLYCYTTYRNILLFLKTQGVQIPRLKSEHLLMFDQYLIYHKYINTEHTETNLFTEEEFYLFSKQCWLDLILRIFKVMVLSRTDMKENNEDDVKDGFIDYFAKYSNEFPYTDKTEVKLLLWLEYHLNTQKSNLFGRLDENPKVVRICKFEDLRDSLALAAVTVAYCPYVKEHLGDLFEEPTDEAQFLHNACRILETWKILNVRVRLNPTDILEPNFVNMIMIVATLYVVLPQYIPEKSLQMEAPLSEESSCEFTVKNVGGTVIGYTVHIFGADSELFKINTTDIKLAPKKSQAVNVTFLAKKIGDCNATLLLCGEYKGLKYADSVVYRCIGRSNLSLIPTISVTATLYTVFKKIVNVISPYGVAYKADIYLCSAESGIEAPESLDEMCSVASLHKKTIPRQVDIQEDVCEFDSTGKAKLTVETCFICCRPQKCLVYFANKDIGDFCVMLSIKVTSSSNQCETITIVLPRNFKKLQCTCNDPETKFDLECEKTLYVQLPSINSFLVQSLCSFMSLWYKGETLFDSETNNPEKFRLLKFYISSLPRHLFPCELHEAEVYTINANENISISKELTIEDVTSEDSIDVPLHWNSEDCPTEELLTLRNPDNSEYRYYNILFLQNPDDSVTPSLSLSELGDQ